MKNISLVLNGVLIVAVAILFVLHFSKPKNDVSNELKDVGVQEHVQQDGNLNVAYVYIDSLLTHFKMAQDMSEQLFKRKQNLESELETKGKTLEKDIADFQYKVSKGLITSWDATEQEKKLTEQQQVFINLQNDMQNRLLAEEQDANLKVHNTVIDVIEEYNKSKGYKLIFSNAFGGVLLHAEDYMNITGDVLEMLNVGYESGK